MIKIIKKLLKIIVIILFKKAGQMDPNGPFSPRKGRGSPIVAAFGGHIDLPAIVIPR